MQTTRCAHNTNAVVHICVLFITSWADFVTRVQESELLPAALKQQLLGGLQLWGKYVHRSRITNDNRLTDTK